MTLRQGRGGLGIRGQRYHGQRSGPARCVQVQNAQLAPGDIGGVVHPAEEGHRLTGGKGPLAQGLHIQTWPDTQPVKAHINVSLAEGNVGLPLRVHTAGHTLDADRESGAVNGIGRQAARQLCAVLRSGLPGGQCQGRTGQRGQAGLPTQMRGATRHGVPPVRCSRRSIRRPSP